MACLARVAAVGIGVFIATDLGRGATATADMKARIAVLRAAGEDVFEALWARHHQAVKLQHGYSYEYAPASEPNSAGREGAPQPQP